MLGFFKTAKSVNELHSIAEMRAVVVISIRVFPFRGAGIGAREEQWEERIPVQLARFP